MGLIGCNAVRPLQRRLDENIPIMIAGIVIGVILVLGVFMLLRKRCGWVFEKIPMPVLAPALCGAFVLYDTLVYLFVSTDEPAIRSVGDLHNILVLISCASLAGGCAYLYQTNRRNLAND